MPHLSKIQHGLERAAISFLIAFSLALPSAHAAPAPSEVEPTALEAEIAAGTERVREFQFIRQEAERLGIRVWLFGGTAAAFGHYSRWNLLRKDASMPLQKERFDDDFTSIYRSTQDADLVIDGTEEQAEALETALRERFPHLQGNKSAWEVRLLSQDRGPKLALLGNPDFLEQHTDSNSTGMIELTTSAQEPRIRDLRQWRTQSPAFLRDLAAGHLRFYFSPSHEQTLYFREGRNPPIFAAIRFLTKKLQYGLRTDPKDETRIKEIIDAWQSSAPDGQDYVRSWITKNGAKLIHSAMDTEHAWNELERLGLRRKLLEYDQANLEQIGSLAWWMAKEPLRSFELGQGPGATAAELGISIVAHETSDLGAYENLTRSPDGSLNALISRSDHAGETAVHGDGFYTSVGRIGARESGYTVRLRVDPRARIGTDFKIVKTKSYAAVGEGDYVVWLNKRALQVIPETYAASALDWLRRLASSEEFAHSDRALAERMNRKAVVAIKTMKDEERVKYHAFVEEILSRNLLQARIFKLLWQVEKESPGVTGISEIQYLKILSIAGPSVRVDDDLTDSMWKRLTLYEAKGVVSHTRKGTKPFADAAREWFGSYRFISPAAIWYFASHMASEKHWTGDDWAALITSGYAPEWSWAMSEGEWRRRLFPDLKKARAKAAARARKMLDDSLETERLINFFDEIGVPKILPEIGGEMRARQYRNISTAEGLSLLLKSQYLAPHEYGFTSIWQQKMLRDAFPTLIEQAAILDVDPAHFFNIFRTPHGKRWTAERRFFARTFAEQGIRRGTLNRWFHEDETSPLGELYVDALAHPVKLTRTGSCLAGKLKQL